MYVRRADFIETIIKAQDTKLIDEYKVLLATYYDALEKEDQENKFTVLFNLAHFDSNTKKLIYKIIIDNYNNIYEDEIKTKEDLIKKGMLLKKAHYNKMTERVHS